MSKYDDLVAKLREIFQIDRPELDFGIYRILNARADEINDYLSSRLKERVAEALAEGAAANTGQLQRDLDEAVKAATALGMSPDDAPRVKELRAALAASSAGASEHENAVFSHLLTFFSRYYDKGDFISQRRYKGDTYAIPYSGEEVVLHWANRDQYYTKSGEAFSNYSFKVQDGRRVHFRLVAADTAKDNRKDNDKERRFALTAARTVTRIDEEGEAYEEAIVPVSEEDGDLIVRFEYRAMPKGTKQESLVDAAVEAVLADEAVKARWLALAERAPTDKKPQRTLLEKHLTTYTQNNTADYFIHKDLGGFLGRELDFYIKNEVMNLDDVQNAESFGAIEKQLRMIQCLRAIALDLIAFLATVEDFQKKLWLKKKFVVSAHYCMTLDRVPEALYPAIAANPAQWAEWHALGLRHDGDPGSVDELKSNPFFMVDTALFEPSFRAALLKAIPDIDSNTDGLLVHGDNFQALRLLGERFREQVKAIYLDPPYNATTSEILYKNGYKHSSWASLMDNRIGPARRLMQPTGVLTIAIDENERDRLGLILEMNFPAHEITSVSVIHNPRGIQGSGFSVTNEFAYFVHSPGHPLGLRSLESAKSKPLMKTGGESARSTAKNCFYPIIVRGSEVVAFGDVPSDDWHPAGAVIERDDGTSEVWPISSSDGMERKWRYARQSVEAVLQGLEVRRGRSGEPVINLAKAKESYRTVWSDAEFNAAEYGSTLLKNMIPDAAFSYPKSLHTVRHSLIVSGLGPSDTALDYFAGSGTTGHAVIELNREDEGRRKYILVEQGDYLDTVLRPRLQKVVFSPQWQDGRPTAPGLGLGHAFKTIRMESYEDTLNNLLMKRTLEQGALLERISETARDDYLFHYMLDIETRDSLLNVQDFRKPFDYRLNIATDSAGAYRDVTIDLVETFNYLIGLSVKHIDMQYDQGFVTVEGTLPTGEKTLVLWRDADVLDYEALSRLCDKLAINPGDSEYDVVYINGDHNIPTVSTSSEKEGEVTRTLRLRQIEPEFLERMFASGAA
ncbi:hypothetical protein GCM10022281_23050 [Sphingomonas rosea]|uniref:site-specific DNA-methyltransferase (adenine-specific) n=1 Tax=Sphingomonas rosea TaxID=335605 RepID=A0ABP7UE72_9SPHN